MLGATNLPVTGESWGGTGAGATLTRAPGTRWYKLGLSGPDPDAIANAISVGRFNDLIFLLL